MRRTLLLVMSVLITSGCPKTVATEAKPDEPKVASDGGVSHVDEKEHDELPKRVKLTKEVFAAAKIETTKAVKEALASTLTLPGQVASDPDRSARVSSPVAGRVVDVRFKEGAAVKKGEILATVRVPELTKIRAGYAANAAKSVAARANATRLGALADKGLASRQEALAATAEAAALDAEGKALNEELAALGMGTSGGGAELALRAPVSGTVLSRDAVIGQPVTSDQTIASLADLAEVWFLARVFEKDLGRVHVGASVEVQLNAFPKETFAGVVDYVSKQIDPAARTLTARVRLTNRGDLLRIGLFGNARVATGEVQPKLTIVIPQNSVTEIGGKPVCFVRHPDDDFELHELVLGEFSAGKVEVLSGLREGEDVVSQGVFTLKSLVLKSALSGED